MVFFDNGLTIGIFQTKFTSNFYASNQKDKGFRVKSLVFVTVMGLMY